MSPISFTVVEAENGQKFVTVFANGTLTPAVDDSHPNFKAIVGACEASLRGESVDEQSIVDLFDVAATIERKFARLSERVTIDGGVLCLDGDPVHGTLQEQILAFVDAGEDFEPLVRFYEKLTTNPLGDVQAGLYDWIAGQTSDGSVVTITPEGDLVGYKGVWPTDDGKGYRPSRQNTSPCRVNDTLIEKGYTVQNVGDVVEMPRANVTAPSAECGVGLHVGTWNYAKTFGPVCLKVKFSPRDVVSAPDRNASWKLRVVRYTVLEVIENGQAHDSVIYRDEDEDGLDVDLTLDGEFAVGDYVEDEDGDRGVVVDAEDEDGDIRIKYDDTTYGTGYAVAEGCRRIHGKGGPTSQAAKGNGRNPAQDEKGRFSNGRPGSTRDTSTGRFA